MDDKTLQYMRQRVEKTDALRRILREQEMLLEDCNNARLAFALPNCSGGYYRIAVPVTTEIRDLARKSIQSNIDETKREIEAI